MRRLLSTISGLALTATASFAADLPRQMPAKAPAYMPVAYNWTGFYLGINGGYGWGRSSWDGFSSGTFNTNGGLIGLVTKVNAEERQLDVEIAEGVRVKVIRDMVSTVLSKTEPVGKDEKADKEKAE